MNIYTLIGKLEFSYCNSQVIGCFSTLENAENAKIEYIEATKTRSDLLDFDSYSINVHELDAI